MITSVGPQVLLEINSADLRVGAVNDALDLAELSHTSGSQFIICGPLTAEFRQAAARRGIRTLQAKSRIFSRWELPLYAFDVLRWLIRLARYRPDIVHLNYPGYGPSLACAARLCGIPVVARAGGDFFPRNPSNAWVAVYFANCEAHASGLRGTPLQERVVVTGDLFRPQRVRATATPVRPLPPKRDGVPRLTFLGQLVERKGLHVLIDALTRMTHACDVLLAGGDWNADGYPQQLKAQVTAAGLTPRVHFENHREDVGAVLAQADIFVLPSFSEARPRSIIEAMSVGIPVVATDAGGIPTLVRHGETGLLVPPGDAIALAAALDRLAGDSHLRRRLGAAAHSAVEAACRPAHTATLYVETYRQLIQRRTARPRRLARATGR